MSWEHWLVPLQSETKFSAEALDEMQAWWTCRATHRRSDGVIALCRNIEFRDHVLAMEKQDDFSIHVEVIRLSPDRITISFVGWQQNIDIFYEFAMFCQSRWPCEVLDDAKCRTTAKELRDRLHATFGSPPSDRKIPSSSE